jgi:hypothetical protein
LVAGHRFTHAEALELSLPFRDGTAKWDIPLVTLLFTTLSQFTVYNISRQMNDGV